MRQQKFKRGKEKMLSIAQESGEGQTLIQPEEEDDDGMRKAARGLSLCSVDVRSQHRGDVIASCARRGWGSVSVLNKPNSTPHVV